MTGQWRALGLFTKKCLEGQPPKKGECDMGTSKHKSRSVPIESLYRWHMQGWNLAYMHTERPFVDQKKRVFPAVKHLEILMKSKAKPRKIMKNYEAPLNLQKQQISKKISKNHKIIIKQS